MEPLVQAEHVLGLHDLVTGSADISSILQGVTRFASQAVSRAAGEAIDCALTLRRRKRTATVAGSSEEAVLLDRIEQGLGSGPCVDALELRRPVLLDDVGTDSLWPDYSRALASHGRRSALGVPMELGETSEAVLNFFAPAAGSFTEEVIAVAAGFAEVAGSTLRLAIRIESVEHLNADLKAAMDSRTVIDRACGVVMAQNRCGPGEAFAILKRASSHRNEKIRDVAAEIISHVAGRVEDEAYFED